MWILWEPSFVNVNFMRAELCTMWTLWELSIVNRICMRAELRFVKANFMRVNVLFIKAEHCECQFYELCVCEFYKSWALWIWIYQNWALECEFMTAEYWKSWFFMTTELCECEFYGSWALQKRISYKLNFAEMSLLRAAHCECEFYESWS